MHSRNPLPLGDALGVVVRVVVRVVVGDALRVVVGNVVSIIHSVTSEKVKIPNSKQHNYMYMYTI